MNFKEMEEIFYQNQDERTGRFIIVDEEENSIWAYLTFPYEERIDKDCYLGSRIKIEIEEFDIKEFKRKQIPPPMTKKFSTTESHLPNLREEDIQVNWGVNGNVILLIGGNPFLFFTEDEDKGFSKSISNNGNYGNKWTDKYKEKFK